MAGAARYYIRYRGRTSGPFETSHLRSMIERGQVSGLHQVSPDGQSWSRVSDIGELAARPGSARAGTGDRPYELKAPDRVIADASRQWYLACHGIKQGPMSEAELRAALADPTGGSDTLVWAEGMSDWCSPAQAGFIKPTAAADDPTMSSATPVRGKARKGSHDRASVAFNSRDGGSSPASPSIDRVGKWVGATASLIWLTSLQFPIMRDDGLYWPAYRWETQGQAMTWVLLAVGGVLIAVTSFACRGTVRAMTWLGLGAVGVGLLANEVRVFADGSFEGVGLFLMLAQGVVVLAALSLWAGESAGRWGDTGTPGRVLAGISGSLICLLMAIILFVGLVMFREVADEPWTGPAEHRAASRLGIACVLLLAFTCHLSLLAAGIMALVRSGTDRPGRLSRVILHVLHIAGFCGTLAMLILMTMVSIEAPVAMLNLRLTGLNGTNMYPSPVLQAIAHSIVGLLAVAVPLVLIGRGSYELISHRTILKRQPQADTHA